MTSFRLLSLLLLAGCSGGRGPDGSGPPIDEGKLDGDVEGLSLESIGGDRPARLFVPEGADDERPLVMLLHGVTSTGDEIERYFRASAEAAEQGWYLIVPDGSKTPEVFGGDAYQFWNAVDGCCDANESGIDDAGYLRSLLEETIAKHSIDRRRVFVVGHSNGGYMAHRLGCDSADLIAAVATLAGGQWTDESQCRPSQPVSVLQVHATGDYVVDYAEGERAIALWSRLDQCGEVVEGEALDLMTEVPGAETHPTTRACEGGTAVSFYSMNSGDEWVETHSPKLSDDFLGTVFGWLDAHPRP